MGIFHRHHWEKIACTFHPSGKPILLRPESKGLTLDEWERVSFGFTNIATQCAGCGAVRIQTVTGNLEIS